MDDIVSGMLTKASENKEETRKLAEIRQAKIQKEMDEVSKKYGRVPTPSTFKSREGRKAAQLEAETL